MIFATLSRNAPIILKAMLSRLFTAHPASVGETYFGHLVQATYFGFRMLIAGIACILHGLFPFLCVSTGSDAMKELNAEMGARRERALKGLPIR